ncbi:putative aldouronate transport system substrate-binding protein [Clostridium saccharoperbutylacetonicum]|uniref:Extracellular solute-binding protein family 1 n=1 Tax=Clostridium saccharoperbutylacetonicum N1-4(HMT) TaxID=931276 RepID=M1MVE4_9CLOT|nr:ABC transporter substrate-binding protein [Clostridium saccharoperbutylacetonicum]AGF58611.1 extracellular solute-binding protein family 1 [Clostridium saccharoperbutylacetonicum N1-4(HMT)]NRT60611.1 putative aldouronate transport system substrate-binding protein [Clostridium saccharoperbutylacetonicum]NSB23925.1 putative aldouronate transport system substrate-binding protein [Clostridium saccharoperbutylacetonicum]NSB43301.1 putative aldouronate transport system substrate-binding protein [C
MKKTKLITSMLLTGVVSLSLLAGCGNQTKETSSASNGKIKEFTAFFAVAGKEIPDNDRVKNVIAEKIGAKVNEQWLTGQTAKERIGVMIAGGEYPDFIEGGEGTQALVDAGALIPLEDKIDKYPNIKNYLTPNEWEQLRKPDGHIYYIQQFGKTRGKDSQVQHNDEAFWIQKAVLEWANYPQIKTVDQYFDLIEKYKAANPTINGQPTIGFDILCDDWRYFCLENPPQFVAGYPNDGKAIIDKATLTAKNYNTIPEAQKYFKKLNEEYNKGIIDPETFTLSYDQYKSKLSTGRVLGMVDQHWEFNDSEKALLQQHMDERTWVPLGLTLDPNVKSQYRTQPAFNTGSGLGITTSCKDVDGALKVINDLLSNDLLALRWWGEKDKDYKVDDKGVFYMTDEQREHYKNQDWMQANQCRYSYFPQYGTGYLDDGINCIWPEQQQVEFEATLSDTDKKVLKGYGYKKWTDFLNVPAEKNEPWFPIYSATGAWSADDPQNMAMLKMDEIKKKWLPKVVMSSTNDFDSTWNQYQTTLTTQADIKAYEDALTKEVKRRVEKFKN